MNVKAKIGSVEIEGTPEDLAMLIKGFQGETPGNSRKEEMIAKIKHTKALGGFGRGNPEYQKMLLARHLSNRDLAKRFGLTTNQTKADRANLRSAGKIRWRRCKPSLAYND